MATSMIEFTDSHITDILGWVAQLVDDLKLLIILILAVFLGMWIVERIIKSIRGDQ